MFHDIPHIETTLEAFDELSDVRMTLSGASSFALALAQSDVADRESLQLLSCLLDYCSLIANDACSLIQDAHQNAKQPISHLTPEATIRSAYSFGFRR